MSHLEIAQQLVTLAGGKVKHRIVEKVGISILYDYHLTAEGTKIIAHFANLRNDDFDQGKMTDFHKLVDFSARITYLSYDKTSAVDLRNKLKALGHLNVYDLNGIAVLVAGCSLECILELVSNRVNRSCRLTSSKTKAAIETLYSKQIDPIWLEQFLALRADFLAQTTHNLESSNLFNLSAKCGYAVISMGMRDWNFLLNARLRDEGLEEELRAVLSEIKQQLKKSPNWMF
ncbi:MAG: Unknown protein [uncultured Aureispira sp.]|uniref:Uncharacterized protein n=1 Tax=uncultured Aureispira sp. TaxID=1331704 RepID=A0A6S6SGJ8_9BACT|nr:MAG: Unknown protein [uncultured Aureispira sp.]